MAEKYKLDPTPFDEFMSEADRNDPAIRAHRKRHQQERATLFAADTTGKEFRHQEEMKARAEHLRGLYKDLQKKNRKPSVPVPEAGSKAETCAENPKGIGCLTTDPKNKPKLM